MRKRKFPWLPLIVACVLVLGYAVLGNRSARIPEENLTVGITPTVLYDEQGTVERVDIRVNYRWAEGTPRYRRGSDAMIVRWDSGMLLYQNDSLQYAGQKYQAADIYRGSLLLYFPLDGDRDVSGEVELSLLPKDEQVGGITGFTVDYAHDGGPLARIRTRNEEYGTIFTGEARRCCTYVNAEL